MSTAVPFGPTGEVVYNRTYSRDKPDGTKETWPETVCRVAKGNLALVHGDDDTQWPSEALAEYGKLVHYMYNFALLPAGRHLWATGVPGRQYLFNCHVAGWGKELAEHFEFSFLRLMEGGGVGANYSTRHIAKFGPPKHAIECHVICNEGHRDIEELQPHLSKRFNSSAFADMDVEDSREGWAAALTDLIECFYGISCPIIDGDTVVYDVSRVRPSGSPLKTFGGTASGPAPFARMMNEVAKVLNLARERGELTPLDAMAIDHAIAECVVSGGNRRSARMSIVHWDDPYIENFLRCKRDTGLHWTTNVSVEIDDDFLAQLASDPEGKAAAVHMAVTAAMLENGEPGYWNSDASQVGEVGPVIATNPCGEIPLQPWENCNLGHVNMDYFWDKPWKDLVEAHRLMTRFLMRATSGDVNDPRQQAILLKNRRIGVGHLGVQGYWAKRGVRYSDIPEHAAAELKDLYRAVRSEARTYAFQLRIPEPVKVTTVAPTGSVAKLPGVSEGIHPVYARWFERRVRFSKRDEAQFQTVMKALGDGFTVEDDVYDASGMTAVVVYPTEDILLSQVRALGLPDDMVQSADELAIEEMLGVQACYQEHWADNAVSYTLNVPEGKYTPQALAAVLADYLPRLKGTTLMVDASRPQSPYTRITREEYQAAAAVTVEDSTDESCKNGACPVR
jgi:adenosylcobalamin-dependent ribonucleoside-triphosphate reductase